MLNSIFSFFVISMIIILVIIFIFIPDLLEIFFKDLTLGQYGEEFIKITRILLLSPIILGISSLYGSIAQSYKKFFVYALSPILYNLGIIVGLIYLYPSFGLEGLAYGVILGAILHFSILVPSVSGLKLVPKFTFKLDWSLISRITSLSIPRTITLASGQLSLLILLILAGMMAVGSISVFTLANNLQSVPIALIGASYSLAAFPALSQLYTNGQLSEFIDQFVRAAKHIFFWSIPFIVLFVVLRAQIVRVLFGTGEFTWDDTRLTAAILAVFSISIFASALSLLFVRGYYAIGQTIKPLVSAIISTIITITGALIFVNLFEVNQSFSDFMEKLLRVDGLTGTSVIALPLAYSIGVISNLIMLWVMFDNKFKNFSNRLWKTVFHIVSASLIMGFVTYLSLNFFADIFNLEVFWGIFLQGLLAGLIGVFVCGIILILMGNEEIKVVWHALSRKIWKSRPLVESEENL